MLVVEEKSGMDLRICTCGKIKKRTCPHILELSNLYRNLLKQYKNQSPYEAFRAGIWFTLASTLGDEAGEKADYMKVIARGTNNDGFMVICGPDNRELVRYYSRKGDAFRLAQRLGSVHGGDENDNRAAILERLFNYTLTENERMMQDRGFPTFRMIFEQSFWHRLAYHCFREFGSEDVSLRPAVNERNGEFTITAADSAGNDICRIAIPRNKVKTVLKTLERNLPNQKGLAIHPIPLKSIFKVSVNTELDLEVRPTIRMLQENGEEMFFESESFERFRYGDLIYVRELGIMAQLERQYGKERRFAAPVKMVLAKSEVPAFLDEHGDEFQNEEYIVDPEVENLRIYKDYDRLKILPEALDRDWCWLDMRYGFGAEDISLSDILEARRDNKRYLPTDLGWIDCRADVFHGLEERVRLEEGRDGRVGLNRMNLLRLGALSGAKTSIAGGSEKSKLLKRFFELKPASPVDKPECLESELRPYQVLGFEWLSFLSENMLGGLLCDEMGLGKTHQAMALMAGMMEKGNRSPMLVICPTTVLSHWQDKLARYAPGLKASVYHGAGRNLAEVLKDSTVLLTSYGIMRIDAENLGEVNWSLVVFDEIQNLKNTKTKSFEAATKLNGGLKIGLTGTPIENSLEDLKALFDLTLPGYFGRDDDFQKRYSIAKRGDDNDREKAEIRKLITPFVLRRKKAAVLTELPEKIEDIMACELSEDQVRLYREAIDSRGVGLADTIRRGNEPVPYIHIFALLGLLKQICNHPALVEGDWSNYENFESGKWNLFKEIMDQCLAGDEKVVVYSQYLDMIRIMESYFSSLGVNHVSLTGQSRNRGDIISRFQNDPDCRIFVGSLKAGGVGIDLVAASVVIHFDRWWNAAREDQATDRVHRIGQRRGVHVFKLVTSGTLEEKISAIIEKKRSLMEDVVQEDDPGLLKTFSKEELIELLSF